MTHTHTADPISALIEAHSAAVAEVEIAKAEVDRLEALDPPPQGMTCAEFLQYEERHPDLEGARKRLNQASAVEEEAYAALVEAARPLVPPALMTLARYACELTQQDEGPPIGDASYAYKLVGGLVGISIVDDWSGDEAA
jgi:hypothetical protein